MSYTAIPLALSMRGGLGRLGAFSSIHCIVVASPPPSLPRSLPPPLQLFPLLIVLRSLSLDIPQNTLRPISDDCLPARARARARPLSLSLSLSCNLNPLNGLLKAAGEDPKDLADLASLLSIEYKLVQISTLLCLEK